MLREVTLGQYYPVDSVIHRLDPRVKLLGTVLFLISLFIVKSWIMYGVAAVALAILIKISNVPFRFMTRGLKSIVILLLISVSFNLFLTPGEVLVQFWILKITREGLHIALMMGARLILLVLGSSLMTLTTTPNQLTDGLEEGLGALKKVGVPVHEISMMMSIALRFIPILIEETDKIMKAQQARGGAFRRANDLAMAMEARCYHGGEGRTKMKPLRYAARDRIAYTLMFLYLGLSVVSRFVALPF